MSKHEWYKSTNKKPCSLETFELHISKFLSAFILKERKERWQYILIKKDNRAYGKANDLSNHLNKSVCRFVSNYQDILNDVNIKNKDCVGIYYDFLYEPIETSLQKIINSNEDTTAIFSIIPGKLAIFFHDEGFAWVCNKER